MTTAAMGVNEPQPLAAVHPGLVTRANGRGALPAVIGQRIGRLVDGRQVRVRGFDICRNAPGSRYPHKGGMGDR